MARKIRYGDKVIVITGKYKGKIGIVKKILKKNKAIVENINIITKHQKPIPNINQVGGLIKKESPIDISNLAIFNSETNKLDYIKFKFKNGKKFRVFKSNNSIINNK
ncbi:MAG: 50S ribosomal protein L24 [Candidatus Lightella neohaematopini]|nr:50S ribosomal protein L24 [Candidatus Lightella neohaematopini]MCV2528819.1 50S ribosomal protein L24 [Candidatus Lightella neohaematopini]